MSALSRAYTVKRLPHYDRALVIRKCPFCGKDNITKVSTAGLFAWEHGEYVQTAFPELTADQREGLVSGVHAECFEEFLPPEEPEDECPSCHTQDSFVEDEHLVVCGVCGWRMQ